MFINKHCGLFEGIQILDWKPKSSCSKDKRYVLDPFPCRKRKKNFHNWKNKYKDKSRPFGYRKKMNAKSSKLHCFICKKQGYQEKDFPKKNKSKNEYRSMIESIKMLYYYILLLNYDKSPSKDILEHFLLYLNSTHPPNYMEVSSDIDYFSCHISSRYDQTLVMNIPKLNSYM